MGTKSHWENVYLNKKADEVSWFQPHLSKSLDLILESGPNPEARIIDVGGGASTLVDDLLGKGYADITVLDISAAALEVSKKRLGRKANQVNWMEGDITAVTLPEKHYDVWHDRAVFHFLTRKHDRTAYLKQLRRSLKPDGVVVIACFSLEGPPKCSGLEVMRYSPETLTRELGPQFTLLKHAGERHKTPFNTTQEFLYGVLRMGA